MTLLEIAKDAHNQPIGILGEMANRHGLISGATGTGKSVTLRKMAENFSDVAVPVFLVDVKGDFSGMVTAGKAEGKLAQVAAAQGLTEEYYHGFPVTFWDIYGQSGIPMRIKLSDMGPLLLSRLMDLNATQQGVLNLIFKIAHDNGWLLTDIKDLRMLLSYISEKAGQYEADYGRISSVSVAAIQRQLLGLESDGADVLFGEPSLELGDLLSQKNGQGMVNILAASKLMRSPKTFSALLLWLLTQLFSEFPEVGDLPLPKLVLFFDEAHLLFEHATTELLQKIEQVVRLIRSKGIGVYFCTQSPLDLPEVILGQLGNRIQHALRAYTPKDQKNVKAAAQTFRANADLNVEEAISTMGVGEALISFLDDKGMPQPVTRVHVMLPASCLTPLTEEETAVCIKQSPLYTKYAQRIDNFSASEAIEKIKNTVTVAENGKTFNEDKHNKPQTRKQASEGSKSGIKDAVSKGSTNMATGFLRGLFGLRKSSRKGMSYDISNEIGKELKERIRRTIMSVIRRK